MMFFWKQLIIVVVCLLVLVSRSESGHGGGGGTSRKIATVVYHDTLALKLNDSKWTAGRQWYLYDGDLTHNVLPVWSNCLRGLPDIVVAVLGDGLNYKLKDLKQNYNSAASYNAVDNTDDPLPYDSNVDILGTQVAALIAASTNEDCGVGVAFNTSIAGLRFDYEAKQKVDLDTSLSTALNKRVDEVGIYVSAVSLPPNENGLVLMGDLTSAAIQNLVEKGRATKGSPIFWPSGETKANDSCAYDAMINDVRTISLAPINRSGKPLKTARACGALLASAYSKDQDSKDPMVTIGKNGQCVEDFTGSAPAAGFGAGITALTLQANPDLTWRDIQHLIVETCNPSVINSDFVTNAAGRKVSGRYGFGLIKADVMTSRALTWSKVGPQRSCTITAALPTDGKLDNPLLLNASTACSGDNEIIYIEHVQISFKLTAAQRKDMQILLTSPSGTTTMIVPGSLVDGPDENFAVTVSSVAYWGENNNGTWTAVFKAPNPVYAGKLASLSLTVLGTLDKPGVKTGYVVLNGTSALNACPVLGPFQIQHSLTTDFTPLYIFIVILFLVFVGILAFVLYKKVLVKKCKCRGCGPRFKHVPQNETA